MCSNRIRGNCNFILCVSKKISKLFRENNKFSKLFALIGIIGIYLFLIMICTFLELLELISK